MLLISTNNMRMITLQVTVALNMKNKNKINIKIYKQKEFYL